MKEKDFPEIGDLLVYGKKQYGLWFGIYMGPVPEFSRIHPLDRHRVYWFFCSDKSVDKPHWNTHLTDDIRKRYIAAQTFAELSYHGGV